MHGRIQYKSNISIQSIHIFHIDIILNKKYCYLSVLLHEASKLLLIPGDSIFTYDFKKVVQNQAINLFVGAVLSHVNKATRQ